MELKALVIENADFARGALMRALKDSGVATFTFAEAKTLKDGVSEFDPDNTDVIFVSLDLHTVGSLTLRFVGKIRGKQKKHVPIIAVTNERASHKLDTAVGLGVDYYMLKPFSTESIRMKLEPIIVELAKARKGGLEDAWARR